MSIVDFLFIAREKCLVGGPKSPQWPVNDPSISEREFLVVVVLVVLHNGPVLETICLDMATIPSANLFCSHAMEKQINTPFFISNIF
jgi:hypothetical protein